VTEAVPDFTICFERTVLVWAPCAFLWLFSFLEVFYILNSKARDVPFTWLNISKFVRSASQFLFAFLRTAFINILHPYFRPVYSC
jgi:hypothetical protein